MSNQENNTGLDLVFNAGSALSIVRSVDQMPFVMVPDGYRIQDLEGYLDAPTRNRGKTDLLDEESFVAFVKSHDQGSTDLFYTIEPQPKFRAVFNASRPGKPNWDDHSAEYLCKLSQQWETWKRYNGEAMTQEEFSLFVERNLPDIVAPEAAAMLEIVTTLQAKKKVNFVSGLRLSDGSNEFTYEEQVDGSAAKGKLKIPEEIEIGIPVFHNGQAYAIQAKFRYRIREGQLRMWYELVRPHLILDDAVLEMRDRIETETGLSALNASF